MEEDNLVADTIDSLYFCSQASSLIPPVMKLPMPPLPTVPGLSMNDESIAALVYLFTGLDHWTGLDYWTHL